MTVYTAACTTFMFFNREKGISFPIDPHTVHGEKYDFGSYVTDFNHWQDN